MARDNFDATVPSTPVDVGRVRAVFDLMPPSTAGTRELVMQYDVRFLDASGAEVDPRAGDLAPHITANRRTAARTFMENLLTKALTVLSTST